MSLKGAYSADPVPPIAPSPTPAISGDPGEEPSLQCHRGYQGSNHCSFPSAPSEPRMIPSPSAGKERERPPRTHQWDKTPNFSPTSPLPAARQRKKPTSPQVGLGSKAACLQPPGRGWARPRMGLQAWSCCGWRGGCRASLTHAEGFWFTLLKSRDAGAGGAACCLPRWSRLHCAKAAPRGPYIHGKGVGGESKVPREEPSLPSAWEVPDQRCGLFPPRKPPIYRKNLLVHAGLFLKHNHLYLIWGSADLQWTSCSGGLHIPAETPAN